MTTDTDTNNNPLNLHDATEGLMSVEYDNDYEHGVLVVSMPHNKRDITPLGAPLHESRSLVMRKFAEAKRKHERAGTDFEMKSYWTVTQWAIGDYLDGLVAAGNAPTEAPTVSGSFERTHRSKPRRVFTFGTVPATRRPIAG